MTPYEIIEKLRATSGTNDKRAILKENKDNILFQKVLTYTFDPRLTFNIKKIPETNYNNGELPLEDAFEFLDNLANRTYTGQRGIEFLANLLSRLNTEDAQTVKWIIAGDFKAGFGVSLVNDEMKPFQVYEVPYMGAISYNEKKLDNIFDKHPYAYSEVKYDGRYLNTVLENDSVFTESRGGNPNPLMGALVQESKEFREAAGFDGVLNGELMIKDMIDRYKANGIISSFVSIAQKDFDGVDITKERAKFIKRHEMTLEEARDRISLVVWDYVPIEDYRNSLSEEARSTRIVRLEEILAKAPVFKMAEYKIVNNKEEAIQHFLEMLARGEEGTILKGANGEWKDGKPVHQMKMKVEIDLDLRIVGFNYGTVGTKNEGVISSLNVESECGLLKTSPQGLKEKDMVYFTENMDYLMGKLIEVKCSGISHDSEFNYSLLYPVYKRVRDDKEHGDTLEKCIEIENGVTGLNKVMKLKS